jgi:hypothetical protein
LFFLNVKSGLEDSSSKKQLEDQAVEHSKANIVDPSLEFGNRCRPVGNCQFKDQEKTKSRNREQKPY